MQKIELFSPVSLPAISGQIPPEFDRDSIPALCEPGACFSKDPVT